MRIMYFSIGTVHYEYLQFVNKPVSSSWVLDVGYWMLGIGCWVLDVGYWMLGIGCWVLDVGYWMLGIGCWVLDVGYGKYLQNYENLIFGMIHSTLPRNRVRRM